MFPELDITEFRCTLARLFCALIVCVVGTFSVPAQSSSQNFPTPALSNEISGTIAARDIGDARLTTYYYAFEGDTGDLFINVVTRNFTGDIDVFTTAGLRPLTKIVVYADLADTETGRVIYLRKPERLLLRVQGRTPGDEPASFRVKFAGSFIAAKQSDFPPEPTAPKVDPTSVTDSRVNSVGTIREIVRQPPSAETVPERPVANVPENVAPLPAVEAAKANDVSDPVRSKPEVVITDDLVKEKPAITPPLRTAAARRAARAAARREAAANAAAARAKENPVETAVDPLASIKLVIEFKDGKSIERPMNDVLRFSVDKGVLTVISKDGRIGRYSILDVGKVTIQ